MKRFNFTKSASYIAIIAALSFPVSKPAIAQSIDIDSSSQSTILDIAQSGVPIVHVDTPNESGVSHNLFTNFNVGRQGLIFNK